MRREDVLSLTRGELLATLEQYSEDFWDQRNWELSLLADKPVEAYNAGLQERKSLANATPVDELPEHEQNWLRAT